MRSIVLAAGLLFAGSAVAQTETPTPDATPMATATPEPAKKSGVSVDTKGGISVKSDDGNFEFKIGGRIHFDAVSIDPDDSPAYAEEGGAYFRRARLSLSGKASGWDFKFENDFADNDATTSVDCDDSVSPPDCSGATTGTSSFREMWLGTTLPYVPGARITIGQFKPLRSMEELTSSNEITMMERPFASASGMFSGRQFAMGAKIEGSGEKYTWGLALQNNSVFKAADTRTTEEPVVTGRVTFAPLSEEGMVVHLGLSGGMENGNTETGARLRGRGKLPATDLGTSRTLAEAGAATLAENKDATHAGLELAGTFSLFYLQAEYMQSTYTDAYDNETSGDPEDATVSTYYVMASAFVTGETKPYKAGLFKSPKPKRSDIGAVELKARYDFAKNDDAPTSSTNEREISVLTVGANWYPNSNVRFMLEYSMADDKTTQVDGDFVKPTAVTLRSQFHF